MTKTPQQLRDELIDMEISPYSSHVRLAQTTDALRDALVDTLDRLDAVEDLIAEKTGGHCTNC
jgi:hypothetical protein